MSKNYRFLIIGGGFYGCCLALFLRSVSDKVILIEKESTLLNRASSVNQARIHAGFHYPRSATTAVKSNILHRKFKKDFYDALVDDFQMLYAISRRGSKTNAKRFYKMFRDIGAPIRFASFEQKKLFNQKEVEDVFACDELAFNFSVLKERLSEKLLKADIDVRLSTSLIDLNEDCSGQINAKLSNDKFLQADYAFNVTYSQINKIIDKVDSKRAKIKHEIAEISLVKPPPQLQSFGVTVMDGEFFSFMPYPTENLYSFTHVRYTPHLSWLDKKNPNKIFEQYLYEKKISKFEYMRKSAQKLMPLVGKFEYVKSIYEVKTVLLKNEEDDGRPILFHRSPYSSRLISVLGAKIDNIYDLFELVRSLDWNFQTANTRFLFDT